MVVAEGGSAVVLDVVFGQDGGELGIGRQLLTEPPDRYLFRAIAPQDGRQAGIIDPASGQHFLRENRNLGGHRQPRIDAIDGAIG